MEAVRGVKYRSAFVFFILWGLNTPCVVTGLTSSGAVSRSSCDSLTKRCPAAIRAAVPTWDRGPRRGGREARTREARPRPTQQTLRQMFWDPALLLRTRELRELERL